MRSKTIASAVIASAALLLSLAGVSPASAATVPVVYIHIIQYSPAGSDTPVTTAKLDGEWVLLTNTTSKSVSLKNWTLRDKAEHVFVFPAFTLKAHKSVEIHTGTGKSDAANLYWGHKPPASTSYVWNNSGKETAALETAAGKTVDARSYTGKSVSTAAQAVFKP